VYGTVHDIIHLDETSCLPLSNSPEGNILYGEDGRPLGWKNGELIFIHPTSRKGNWIMATYDHKVIGWVNAKYVWY